MKKPLEFYVLPEPGSNRALIFHDEDKLPEGHPRGIRMIEYGAYESANIEISHERLRTANAIKEREEWKVACNEYQKAFKMERDNSDRLKNMLADLRADKVSRPGLATYKHPGLAAFFKRYPSSSDLVPQVEVRGVADWYEDELELAATEIRRLGTTLKICRHYMTDGNCPEDVVGEIDEALGDE